MIEIIEYKDSFKEKIGELIVHIQQKEFGINITLAAQPDLGSIQEYYLNQGGNFWVAVDHGEVVGTVSLLRIKNNKFALRKMFVASQYRGASFNVAGRLLHNAETWARQREGLAIYLGTTERFKAAHRFYEKHGYNNIQKTDLPSDFPVMSVDSIFYNKKIS